MVIFDRKIKENAYKFEYYRGFRIDFSKWSSNILDRETQMHMKWDIHYYQVGYKIKNFPCFPGERSEIGREVFAYNDFWTKKDAFNRAKYEIDLYYKKVK